jgi:hypothetical protein
VVDILQAGEWYIVRLKDEELAMFAYLLDASCFAQQLIERGLASEMTLPCGMTM